MFMITLLSLSASVNAVPVIPNKAFLTGIVKEYCLTSSGFNGIVPEQTLFKLTIFIDKAEDVEGHPNFLKGKEGQTIPFFTKEKPNLEIYGERVKAIIEYKGDERGGLFWIKDIEIVK